MEAAQWHLVHTYKHQDQTDHRLFHGNTDRPWKKWHRNNTRNFRKFTLIFPEISRNLFKNFFHIIRLNYNHIKINNKHVFEKQLSKSLCFNFMHYVQKNNLFLARLPRISANENGNYKHYNFQALANISANFQKISGDIKYPENLQP